MKSKKHPRMLLLCLAILFGTSGCADDNGGMMKMLMAAGLGGLGAYAGYKFCKRDYKGACVAGGGVLGFLAGITLGGGMGSKITGSTAK